MLYAAKEEGARMATDRANDLLAFKKFIDEQLSNGGAELKLDEVLARWEYENQTPEEQLETIQAIREGLEEMDAGKSKPVHEVIAELRKKHDVTSPASALQDTPDQWAQRLKAWVGSLPVRPTKMNDSRESRYAGRGE
jgi:hypothetical protein